MDFIISIVAILINLGCVSKQASINADNDPVRVYASEDEKYYSAMNIYLDSLMEQKMRPLGCTVFTKKNNPKVREIMIVIEGSGGEPMFVTLARNISANFVNLRKKLDAAGLSTEYLPLEACEPWNVVLSETQGTMREVLRLYNAQVEP